MRLKEDRGTLRGGPILLLGLWALLGPVQCSPGRPLWRYISSEVVIPRKQMHRGRGIEVPGWVSYSLKFSGQRHVIHMRLKNLFKPRHLPVMSQDDQGALQMDYPYVPRGCYYIGYLEDIPYSLVTVDTCYGGIEGIMKLDDFSYEIKPLKDSLRFEHVVSQIVAERNATGPSYRPGYKEDTDSLFSAANISAAPRISSKYFSSHPFSIKGLPQCSLSMYSVFNNFTNCVHYMVSFTSLIDSLIWGLHGRYIIYGLIIYNAKDPAPLNNYNVPGSPFHAYFSRNIFQTINPHSSFLLDKNGPRDFEFTAHRSSICTANSLVMVGQLGRHYFLMSTLTTQHVTRTIGVVYDDPSCSCQRRTYCIMTQFPGMTDAFSNCTIKQIAEILRSGTYCLYKLPEPFMNATLTEIRCGNGKVEAREQCDCGSLKQCYGNPCCETNCRLTAGSVCNVGECCTNCTYSPSGTLCRPIINICDLPEYCTGNTFQCPDNFYLQDGTPCTEEGYCYRGNCTDRNMHCREIFGKQAVNAADICYQINTKANRFGHCTRNVEDPNFFACADEDVKCGRLQCSNITQLPRLQEHVSFHQSLISGALCFGLDEHRATETTDVGLVRNGSPCAKGKFCNNTYCNAIMSAINYDCLPQKCSFRGICNNRGNCHCHTGWEPPLCLRTGSGGSVDSGPPPRRTRAITPRKESVTYLRVIYGRIYGLIFAFLIGLATNVRAIKITES
ncbi:disintegrin and metalloproteinase domain-containing protein 29-like [Choloepus didactylus]|uniref:disintegrin and metalloproteinase domain-containing protein 29-like n=1 Tax=Choloepus didactylus TaxID=27675 RepID=UPI00189ED3D8|nr:disintegrin and metalloproteinase domain-containing protein 29-like [Choloepus didactylus]